MNICVHRYLQKCLTNPQPPGLADFIRGTKALFILSTKFNYKLLIDYNIHPVFKYFKFNENIYINEINTNNTIELLPPVSYQAIFSKLLNLFNSKQNLYLLTNSQYYIQNHNDIYILNNSNNFIKEMLKPSDLLEEIFLNKINEINIDINNYIIIHLRINDDCFFNENFILDKNFDNLTKEKIKKIIDDNYGNNILVLSNYSKYLEDLKNIFNNIYITNNLTIHLGSLDNENMENKIQGTLIDLLFMSKSKKIFNISQYGGRSGFSYEIAQIYNIPLIYL